MPGLRPAAVLSLAAAVLALPLILYGFPILGHDARQHLFWCLQFSSQFWAGDLYPRWLTGLYNGFGGPTFFVYGPFPYFVMAALAPIGRLFPHKPPGAVELGLSAFLALWGSGLAAYFWLRQRASQLAALSGALVYLISPYHLTVDLYMRAALPEFWSFVWMPAILYFTERLIQRKRYALAGVAASYALLLTTHLLTSLMFSPVPAAYVLFAAKREHRAASLARLCAAMLLGIGLASVYVLPALDHERFVSSARFLTDPVFQWDTNFPPVHAGLFRHTGPWPDYPQFLAVVTILFAAALLCFAILRSSGFWLGIGAASLFLTLPLSAIVWRILPLIETLQFPWRFLTVTTLAVAALTARMPDRRGAASLARFGLCGIALTWLAFFGYMFHRISQQNRQPAWIASSFADSLLRTWSSPGAMNLGETPIEQVRFESGAGIAKIDKWAPRDIRLQVRCDRDSTLLFHQFYYPGWKAKQAGGADLPLDASSQGVIRVGAPAGQYELRLWLDGGRMETAGKWMSAVSLMLLLAVSL